MKLFISFIMVFSLIACDLGNIFDATADSLQTGLSDGDIVNGLKEALRVGTDSSISVLGVTNGYFADEAVKILLPPEANAILKYKDDATFKSLGLAQKFDDLILGINRAAEWTVDSTGPIFYSAIFDSMTITDGLSILNGNDTAATHYLKKNTFTSLTNLFYPYMDQALSINFIGDFTPKGLWTDITTNYNKAANLYNSGIAITNALGTTNLTPYNIVSNTDLTSWTTKKALSGIFLKVGEQEALIRHDPVARVTDILKTVFGSVTDNTATANN